MIVYRVDGQLMGISVIDILPSCISSVYFIWDPDWAWASLGKWSAMREIALARDIRGAGAEDMKWVYMGTLRAVSLSPDRERLTSAGYWIADCAKMRYKSEYSPSCLLDPVSWANLYGFQLTSADTEDPRLSSSHRCA